MKKQRKFRIYRPRTGRRLNVTIIDITRKNGTKCFKIYTHYGKSWSRARTVVSRLGKVTVLKEDKIKGK